MPRGIYDRSKMKKKLEKGVAAAIEEARVGPRHSREIRNTSPRMGTVRAALKEGTRPVQVPAPVVELKVLEAVQTLKTLMRSYEYTECHISSEGVKLRQNVEYKI